MTRSSRPRLMRPVRETPSPVDALLAAFELWARPGHGQPAAYLELGDGELTAEFVLTAAHVSQLAALLQDATSDPPRSTPSPAARHGA